MLGGDLNWMNRVSFEIRKDMHYQYECEVPDRIRALCQYIRLLRIDQLECDRTILVQLGTIRNFYDRQGQCESNLSSTSLTFYGNLPTTFVCSSLCIRLKRGTHKKLIMRFQYKDCHSIRSWKTVKTFCPIISVIGIVNGDVSCRTQISSERNISRGDILCNDSSKCSIPAISSYDRTASIYLHCKDNNNKEVGDINTEAEGVTYLPDDNVSVENLARSSLPDEDHSTYSTGRSSIPDEDHSTYSTGRSSIPDEDHSTYSTGGPNYAAIAGGIVGGILLIICIIVGVFLLRRRNCTESSKEQIITSLNPSYDPTHVQAQTETNQQGHLMNSADTSYVSISHAIHVDNTTNEESNTYSHIRNAVDDSDVMYDHTIRHNVHDTCDGDYGIAHMRITEDDYDVSGNYRRSPSKEADPVYN
ncbi:unnamed protein product [Mytilus edulis]|uniref:Uncharacterized protein n=1 Tax=Mytilus edulis TaxID=6550 RepID=A0A8S3UZR2_MYTED|nr:unnamed protein product [Mytilus edulis]